MTTLKSALANVLLVAEHLESLHLDFLDHDDDRECLDWLRTFYWSDPENRRLTKVNLGPVSDTSWKLLEPLQDDLKHVEYSGDFCLMDDITLPDTLTRLNLSPLIVKTPGEFEVDDSIHRHVFQRFSKSSKLTLRSLRTTANNCEDF
ncbi:hypothetical protein JCM8547_002044 [Rhodosporidiobolus lusitaniae]